MNTTLAIGGAAAAVVGVALVERAASNTGPCIQAAAAKLAGHRIAGLSHADYARMVDAHAAMWRSLDGKTLSSGQLAQACTAWLDAYTAGAKAPTGDVNFSLFVPWATQVVDGVSVELYHSADYDRDCTEDRWGYLKQYASPLGKAICQLRAVRYGLQLLGGYGVQQPADRANVKAATLAVAQAMDERDVVVAGSRWSDQKAHDPVARAINDLPRKLGSAIGGLLGGAVEGLLGGAVEGLLPTLLLVAGAGFLLWKVTR